MMSERYKSIKKQFVVLTALKLMMLVCCVNAAAATSVVGSAGRDFIVTGPAASRVEAGAGDDFLLGGNGNNTYVINKDDGQDTIFELAGTNIVEFGAGISFSDVASGLMKSGDDLVLRIGQAGQTLTIKFFFSHSNTIAQFRLSNGQVITAGQLYGAFGLAAPTAVGQVPQLITAQAPDVELSGSAGADVLIARHGTLRMQSFAGNDILVPRGPAVTMEFGMGSGNNLIVAYEGDNTVLFSADVGFNDIAMNLRRSGDDLQLINSRDGSQINVYQFFSRANTISRIRFASGGEISAAQIFGLFGVAIPEQAFHYFMVSPGVSFDHNTPGSGSGGDNGDDGDTGGGDDNGGDTGGGDNGAPCTGPNCDADDEAGFIVLQGTEQDDLLIADQRNSLFRAGRGNDIMIGGAGNNRYVVSKGNGADVIIDTQGHNEVHFTADIVWSDINSGLMRSGNDLTLRIGQSGQTLTVQNFFSLANTIELFKLDSGQTLTRQQLFPIFSATAPTQSLAARQLMLAQAGQTLLQGSTQGDILLNRMAVTTVDAKAGDDIIILQYTAATPLLKTRYIDAEQTIKLQFAQGHGKDVVYTLGDTRLSVVLDFAAGISRQQLFQNMRRVSNDLFIKTYSDNDEIRLVNFFSHYNHLELIRLAGEDNDHIYTWDIYSRFNRERPEQPLQLQVGLPGDSLLNCDALFARFDAAAQAGFQYQPELSIQPPADLTVSIFRNTHLPFTASTVDNALVCFALGMAPQDMSIQADTGVVNWAPDRSDIGSRQIQLKVVTDAQTYSTAEFALHIPDLNQPPLFITEPKTVAFNTVAFTDSLTARDVDNQGEDISFSLMSAPTGLQLSVVNAERINLLWTPTAEQVGLHLVVIRAQDKYGKYSELSYHIDVKTFYTLAELPPGHSRVPKTGANTFNSPFEDGATRYGTERVFERDHDREVVIDRVSGLIWQDNVDVTSARASGSAVVTYCSNLNLGGISNWRAPSRLEMLYLLDLENKTNKDNKLSIDNAFKYLLG